MSARTEDPPARGDPVPGAPLPRISSPCTGVCTLDAGRFACVGCRRSVDEIAAWGRYTEVERLRIMAELAQRCPSGDPIPGG